MAYPEHRPAVCPRCGSTDLLPIYYGLIRTGPRYEEIKARRAVMGGCSVTRENPTWECAACRLRGGRFEDENPEILAKIERLRAERRPRQQQTAANEQRPT